MYCPGLVLCHVCNRGLVELCPRVLLWVSCGLCGAAHGLSCGLLVLQRWLWRWGLFCGQSLVLVITVAVPPTLVHTVGCGAKL